MPARAPPSIVMLQIVIRPSIESASIAGPAYSIAWPTPPATPIRPIAPSTMSLAVTPKGSSPTKRISIVFGRAWSSVWVASTCSTSEVPIPNASAPNAPWVEVCESPQTIVIPGWVSPSSGPITWTIPSLPLPVAFSGTPNSAQFARQRVELGLGDRVADRARLGRDVVIHRRDRQVGPPHRAAGEPQRLERLRARHLVDEVQVDVEQRRLARLLVDDVRLPDLVEQRASLNRPLNGPPCRAA